MKARFAQVESRQFPCERRPRCTVFNQALNQESHDLRILDFSANLGGCSTPFPPTELEARFWLFRLWHGNADFSLNEAENTKLIRHIEGGGIRTLLYGGNANFYHIAFSEYDQVLGYLAQTAGADTLVIPSAGPAYGTMMDQAKILRRHKFPTVMVLPQQGITTSEGVAEGISDFVQAAGVPAILYIKADGFIEPEHVKKLADAKVISAIKYATVRSDTSKDDYFAGSSSRSIAGSSSAASASSRRSFI